MRVENIQATGFMSHDTLEVNLPDSGVVVVTGSNGAGKSSIIEAVATAIWGKTLRGASPWRDTEAGVASVTAEGECVKRSRSVRGRSVVDISGDASYDTARAAQSVLTARWGDLETWRRTSVFSASDADAFTTAPDAERKRLLERLLGLARFDAAHRAARDDARDAGVVLIEQKAELESLRSREAAARASVEASTSALTALDAVADAEAAPVDPEKVDAAKRALAEALEDTLTAERTLKTIDDALTSAARIARAANSALSRLEQMGECPTCQQPIGEDRLDVARRVAEKAEADAAQQEASLNAQRVAAEEDVAIAQTVSAQRRARVDKLRDAEVRWYAEQKNRARHATLADDLARRIQAATATMEKVAREIAEQERAVSAAQHAVDVLDAVVMALGTRGVRAHITGEALSGLEAVANHWLSRLTDNVRIALAINDQTGRQGALRLDVYGAGGGHGYKGASAGERRRIDVAMLFALAETASAAAGRGQGTLWVDEAFDSLDSAGVAAVTQALSEIAQDRCVVVITHSDELAAQLPAKTRIHISPENAL